MRYLTIYRTRISCQGIILHHPGFAPTRGRFFCKYGYRYEPFGIRAVVPTDHSYIGATDHILPNRDDLLNRDLRYSATVLTTTPFTTYDAQDNDGKTCSWGTLFALQS